MFRSLRLSDLIAAHLLLRQRLRGFSEAPMIISILLLQALGGDGPDDLRLLANDACRERGLGYVSPQTTAAQPIQPAKGRKKDGPK